VLIRWIKAVVAAIACGVWKFVGVLRLRSCFAKQRSSYSAQDDKSDWSSSASSLDLPAMSRRLSQSITTAQRRVARRGLESGRHVVEEAGDDQFLITPMTLS
jgi:hypothetical protein